MTVYHMFNSCKLNPLNTFIKHVDIYIYGRYHNRILCWNSEECWHIIYFYAWRSFQPVFLPQILVEPEPCIQYINLSITIRFTIWWSAHVNWVSHWTMFSNIHRERTNTFCIYFNEPPNSISCILAWTQTQIFNVKISL